MVFKNIDQITDKKDKSKLIEKIQLHIRIVQCLSEIHKIVFDKVSSDVKLNTISKIKEIGIISNEDDIIVLQKLINPLFIDFIKSVNFSLLYPKLIGSHLDKLNNKIRLEYQKKEARTSKPTVVDFFCGAGGLSLGFVKAGYKVIFANDHEDVCIDTYSYNHPEVKNTSIVNGDIKDIVNNLEDFINKDADIVVGGPPCQGFSSANQQRIIDDPRNELYKYFIKAVEKLSPKFVVMENVRGMLPYANQIKEDYQNIKSFKDNKIYTYDIDCRVLTSNDYGVAQKRHRLIFLAIRKDIGLQFKVSPSDILNDIVSTKDNNEQFHLSDALNFIKELEANRKKNTNELDSEVSGKKVDSNSYTGKENSYLLSINENRTIPIIFNHKARFVSDLNFDIYRLLNQGDDATDEKIVHLMPYSHRNNVFKDKYYKLIADRPSRTITAHLRMDCHSHIHPFQVRSITPREAARIQSFPDDYVFLGAYLKTYMQIGNAVPPLMAKVIAENIIKYL